MAAGPEIDWIPGVPRRWWLAGFLSIIWGSVILGQLAGLDLGLMSQEPTSWIAPLVPLGIAAAIGFPGAFGYSIFMPTAARMGLMSDGVIVDARSPRYPYAGFRQGYRWDDLQLRGHSLILPRLRPRSPRSIRLTGAQFDRMAPRIAPG